VRRTLISDYCMGIRSERRLRDAVRAPLARRWFCRLGLEGDVPNDSTPSKNRHGRLGNSDLLCHLFEMTVARRTADSLSRARTLPSMPLWRCDQPGRAG